MPLSSKLRLIATTDIHMHLSARHPVRDDPVAQGLEALVPLLQQAQAEEPLSMLLDNGDWLQGTPMGEWHARVGHCQPHPARQCFKALGFTATSLGNHEFDFGLEYLGEVLSQPGPSVLCCNITAPVPLQDRLIVEKNIDGVPLKIGLTGTVPPRIMVWHREMLTSQVTVRPPAEAVIKTAAKLRAEGADLVICLAHAGIVPAGHAEEAGENAAAAIAATGAVDAVICGHQHMLFPSDNFECPGNGIDPVAATLHGIPAIMPPAMGAGIGLLDLELCHTDDRWNVQSHTATLRFADQARSCEILRPLLTPAEAATRQRLDTPLSYTSEPLSSAFSLAVDGPELRIVHAAQLWAAAQHIFELPVLSAASPFKTGGRNGPDYFTRIPEGLLTRRSVADIYPFENELIALKARGAQLQEWLEMSASAYNQCHQGSVTELLEEGRAGFNVDSLCGLRYDIDLSMPGRYNIAGQRISDSYRCRTICFAGAPVLPEAEFIILTNGYRAGGGGSFPGVGELPVVFRFGRPVQDVLVEFLAAHPDEFTLPEPFWRLVAPEGSILRHSTDHLASPPVGWVHKGLNTKGYGVFEHVV